MPDALAPFRERLAAARSEGVPFGAAWVRNERLIPSAYRPTMWATREAWKRAYSGEPPEPYEAAPARLFAALQAGVLLTSTGPLPERRDTPSVAAPVDEQCRECGKPVHEPGAVLCGYHYIALWPVPA